MQAWHPSARAAVGQEGSEVPGLPPPCPVSPVPWGRWRLGDTGLPACTPMAVGAWWDVPAPASWSRAGVIYRSANIWHHKCSQENCWRGPSKHPGSATALEWDCPGVLIGEGSWDGF